MSERAKGVKIEVKGKPRKGGTHGNQGPKAPKKKGRAKV